MRLLSERKEEEEKNDVLLYGREELMAKEVLLFGKNDCGLCQGWKKKLENFKVPFKYLALELPENLAEFAYQGFTKIPALVIAEKKFEGIKPSDLTIDEITGLLESD